MASSCHIFGFSRGAYTARSVGGMIDACGLPTSSFSDDMVTIGTVNCATASGSN